MNAKYSVIFLLGVVAYTVGYPALSSETELIDPKYGDQPIVDTGVVAGGGFFDSPFDVFQSMEGMMRRMREQLNGLLNRFGPSSNGTITDVEDFSNFGFPSIPNLDLGKGNTTSVTKIINGQKVVINETRYGKENENGGAFFKVRVIEVKPNGEGNTEITRDVESIENSQDNEIQKKSTDNEVGYGRHLTFDDIDFIHPRKFSSLSKRWGNIENYDEDNNIDGPLALPPITLKPYDLSRDTYVNKLLADKGYPMNPDAELVETNNRNGQIQRGHDMSHDIWVNRLMSDQAMPNPDAEIFQNNMKRFEKFINPR